jgi:hypothetical protein
MSFRLFIYYCALCGAAGAFAGWVLGRSAATPGNPILAQGLKAMWLGVTVALALGLVDALWNFSPRQILSIGGRVLTALLVGSMGGLLGGLISQALYQWKHHDAFLVFGWTFIGLLIGLSLGVFDLTAGVASGQNPRGAVRKIVNGVLGGTIGGLLGGFLSLFVRGAWSDLFQGKRDDLLWSPSALGFVVLGACIGLLIGLAQVILKEAWLRVEAGPRAGRELILAKPEITLGRAEACDVGLFGDPTVEKLHARIRRQGNDYVLSDAGSAGGTFVNDDRVHDARLLRSGDVIRLGHYVLRFGERRKRDTVVSRQ